MEHYYTRSFPALKNQYGSNGALIWGELDYWSKKYPQSFWKFIEPCDHREYREGDSFQEKLGFNRKTFLRNYKKFGTCYASRTAYEIAIQEKGLSEAFDGKEWIKIYDRKNNKTYFLRDHEYKKETHSADDLICFKNIQETKIFSAHQQNRPVFESEKMLSADEPVYPKNTFAKND